MDLPPVAMGNARGERQAATLGIATQAVCTLPLLLLGTLAVEVRRDLHFGEASLGLLASSVVVAAALVTIPAGRACDVVGGKRALIVCASAGAASLAGVAVFGRSWLSLLPWLLLAGAAMGTAQPASDVWLTRTVRTSRQGTMFGLKQAVVGPGIGLVAGLAVPATQATYGWRSAFVVGVVLALVLLGGLSVTSEPGHPHRAASTPGGAGASQPLVSLRQLLMLGIVGGLGTGPFMAYLALGVGGAVDSGLSEGSAGSLFAFASVAAIGMRLLLGSFTDRREGEILMVVGILLATGALGFGLLCSGSIPAIAVGMPMVAATAGGWHGLFFLVVARVDPLAPGRASGFVAAGVFVGGIAGPLAVGACAQSSYALAWAVASGWSVAAAGSAVALGRFLRHAAQVRSVHRPTDAYRAHA